MAPACEIRGCIAKNKFASYTAAVNYLKERGYNGNVGMLAKNVGTAKVYKDHYCTAEPITDAQEAGLSLINEDKGNKGNNSNVAVPVLAHNNISGLCFARSTKIQLDSQSHAVRYLREIGYTSVNRKSLARSIDKDKVYNDHTPFTSVPNTE